MSKLKGAFITEIEGGRSQNVGTGQSAPTGGNDLGAIVAGRRTVHGKQAAGMKVGGQPSAPIKFRMAAPGAGKPGKRVTE